MQVLEANWMWLINISTIHRRLKETGSNRSKLSCWPFQSLIIAENCILSGFFDFVSSLRFYHFKRCSTKRGWVCFLWSKTEQRHLFPPILPPSPATSWSCRANGNVDRGIWRWNKGDAIPAKWGKIHTV